MSTLWLVQFPPGCKYWTDEFLFQEYPKKMTFAHTLDEQRPKANRNSIDSSGGYSMQNKSHAVMAQRTEGRDSLDDFPTPPWATRALLRHVIGQDSQSLGRQTCLEPACGVGHMAKVLAEFFGTITCYDIHDYGFGQQRDYLKGPIPIGSWDWVITNPPFRLAEQFVDRSLEVARQGVAILARTVFIESVGRYERLFKSRPPTTYAQFTERVPMLKGRLDKKATTATSYCWLVWHKPISMDAPRLIWIPPCRKQLEKESDYALPTAPIDNILKERIVG